MRRTINIKSYKPVFFIIATLLFNSCASNSRNVDSLSLFYPAAPSKELVKNQTDIFQDGTPVLTSETAFKGQDSLLVTFAGDLMAHKPNWDRGHFDEIYEDIKDKLHECPLVFANLETPVCYSKPIST